MPLVDIIDDGTNIWPELPRSGIPDSFTNTATRENGVDPGAPLPRSAGQLINWTSDERDELVGASWYECPGTLNNVLSVNALPDWGSTINAVSAHVCRASQAARCTYGTRVHRPPRQEPGRKCWPCVRLFPLPGRGAGILARIPRATKERLRCCPRQTFPRRN
jgi:hypothetical protein